MYAVRLQEMMQSMMDGLYSKDVGGVDQNDDGYVGFISTVSK